MGRVIALLLLLIPGIISGYGIKLMRDMLFGKLQAPFPYLWMQFLSGLIFFVLGLGFIAGFILHRDRKRNQVQERFKLKKR
ncbi:DUF2627 domain-containing protein [Lederbergia wuyishanensis]|uniref:Mn2+ efflux pump MntP n=1 Tax=Lederbergia wuyishanensis TaxID=1347903 RepID=A0ABU0D173_9BACI|nr:DUF2627 domain-containing protein [Lederbergia wuyishanensis]MCJ8006776.1 DUF2627 domain-containing protein [Lederbergia wuyishanensis]MDQ0342158.1 putative Mn2+ efflux pump MntP [Lederbergia wuyishanensis]